MLYEPFFNGEALSFREKEHAIVNYCNSADLELYVQIRKLLDETYDRVRAIAVFVEKIK